MSCVSMLGTVVAERREVPKWSKRGTQCEDTRILWVAHGRQEGSGVWVAVFRGRASFPLR